MIKSFIILYEFILIYLSVQVILPESFSCSEGGVIFPRDPVQEFHCPFIIFIRFEIHFPVLFIRDSTLFGIMCRPGGYYPFPCIERPVNISGFYHLSGIRISNLIPSYKGCVSGCQDISIFKGILFFRCFLVFLYFFFDGFLHVLNLFIYYFYEFIPFFVGHIPPVFIRLLIFPVNCGFLKVFKHFDYVSCTYSIPGLLIQKGNPRRRYGAFPIHLLHSSIFQRIKFQYFSIRSHDGFQGTPASKAVVYTQPIRIGVLTVCKHFYCRCITGIDF